VLSIVPVHEIPTVSEYSQAHVDKFIERIDVNSVLEWLILLLYKVVHPATNCVLEPFQYIILYSVEPFIIENR
jgi:hypothetical protein